MLLELLTAHEVGVNFKNKIKALFPITYIAQQFDGRINSVIITRSHTQRYLFLELELLLF